MGLTLMIVREFKQLFIVDFERPEKTRRWKRYGVGCIFLVWSRPTCKNQRQNGQVSVFGHSEKIIWNHMPLIRSSSIHAL